MNIKSAIGILVVMAAGAVLVAFKPQVSNHRACKLSTSMCKSHNLNLDCDAELLNFCTVCTSPQFQRYCNGPAIPEACDQFVDTDLCGEKWIAFCEVDGECHTYSYSGAGCSGTDCIQ